MTCRTRGRPDNTFCHKSLPQEDRHKEFSKVHVVIKVKTFKQDFYLFRLYMDPCIHGSTNNIVVKLPVFTIVGLTYNYHLTNLFNTMHV